MLVCHTPDSSSSCARVNVGATILKDTDTIMLSHSLFFGKSLVLAMEEGKAHNKAEVQSSSVLDPGVLSTGNPVIDNVPFLWTINGTLPAPLDRKMVWEDRQLDVNSAQ